MLLTALAAGVGVVNMRALWQIMIMRAFGISSKRLLPMSGQMTLDPGPLPRGSPPGRSFRGLLKVYASV